MSSGLKETDFDSPRVLKRLLEERGLTVKKRYGQNFLINSGARKRIVDALELRGGELVWEIGPGIGSVTSKLIGRNIRLFAFEIDRGFVRVLTEAYPHLADFTIVVGDFIKTWPAVRDSSGEPDLIVGNLPYSSAAETKTSPFTRSSRPTTSF